MSHFFLFGRSESVLFSVVESTPLDLKCSLPCDCCIEARFDDVTHVAILHLGQLVHLDIEGDFQSRTCVAVIGSGEEGILHVIRVLIVGSDLRVLSEILESPLCFHLTTRMCHCHHTLSLWLCRRLLASHSALWSCRRRCHRRVVHVLVMLHRFNLFSFRICRSTGRRSYTSFRSNIDIHPWSISEFCESSKKFTCLLSFHAQFAHTIRVTEIRA